MKVLSNTIYYLFVLAIAMIALLLLSTLVPIPGNFNAKVVKSGSMEPAIKTGAIVLIRPADSYVVGDVVTFGKDTKTQIPTTHRIVRTEGEGRQMVFITKGDANNAEDPIATKPSDIRGKVVFSVPYLGYVLDFAKKPLGFALLVGVPALIIIFEEIVKIIREVKTIRRRKEITNESPE